jgi:hypothetical protein
VSWTGAGNLLDKQVEFEDPRQIFLLQGLCKHTLFLLKTSGPSKSDSPSAAKVGQVKSDFDSASGRFLKSTLSTMMI